MSRLAPPRAPESAEGPSREPPLHRIEPSRRWWSLRGAELWSYRELLFFLAWRDIKVRYKQTALGAAWAILQPTLAMVVFTLFFGHLAGLPSDGVPYALFSFAGLLPWTYYSTAVTLAANSLVTDQSLVTKVYFPRVLIPTAPVAAGLIDLALAGGVLAVLMGYYGYAPPIALVALPLLVLLAIAAALGVGLWLAALNVRYRDVKYVVPFMLQLWLFISPIAYPSSLIDEPWRTLYGLNPMAGVADGFRWAVLGVDVSASEIVLSAVSALLILVGGFLFFRRTERSFADLI
jgi:lipopolysaccharide transport system permease protein